ncbi:MAG: hypothetical protein B7Z30_14190 [Rhizobiales bacterium 12-68-15]|nr:MAG: hypothetical protein B7Z30_14190 [Rhizobiales bacterium 12-68-15]
MRTLALSFCALSLCALLAVSTVPVQAQIGTDPRPPNAPGPALPPPQPGENLTDQLNRTDGVIPPTRNVDPGMTHPAPPVGTTPVIPPPDLNDTPPRQ